MNGWLTEKMKTNHRKVSEGFITNNKYLAVVDTWFLLTSQQVMLRRMMFSKVIGIIALTFIPTHLYLIPYFSVSQPMIAHVPVFGAFLLHVIMYETMSSRVIGLKWCWWFGMVKGDKSMSDRQGLLSVHENA